MECDGGKTEIRRNARRIRTVREISVQSTRGSAEWAVIDTKIQTARIRRKMKRRKTREQQRIFCF